MLPFDTQLEAAIEKKLTTLKNRIVTCGNVQCNSTFILDVEKFKWEEHFLCDSCKEKMLVNHIIQCKCCNNVIGFVHTVAEEKPTVFYMDRCSKCEDYNKTSLDLSKGFHLDRII